MNPHRTSCDTHVWILLEYALHMNKKKMKYEEQREKRNAKLNCETFDLEMKSFFALAALSFFPIFIIFIKWQCPKFHMSITCFCLMPVKKKTKLKCLTQMTEICICIQVEKHQNLNCINLMEYCQPRQRVGK